MSVKNANFTLRGLDANDIEKLHAVEAAATTLIADAGYPSIDVEPFPMDEFRLLLDNGDVIVAEIETTPVGFSVAHDVDGVYWLRELSVDPAFGRRGIGTALVRAVIDRANWAFYNAVGLSTFRTLPFNQPFYEKLGFVAVNHEKSPTALKIQFESEIPSDIPPGERVLMVRKL